MNLAVRAGLPVVSNWAHDAKMVSLVRRTSAKDCNEDEFNQFIAVARDLNLNPLRKQIYAFVFNKGNAAKRNMVLVVSIDGARSIAARSGNYRADNRAPRFTFDETFKGPTNPLGVISAEVSAFSFSHGEWHEVVGVSYWSEAAPIKSEPEEFEMVDTGEKWPDGNKKMRKQAKPGSRIIEKLDSDKDGWRKMPHLMLAKCAEMQALRKGWPEDMSRIYADEETHRAQIIDGEWTDLTPSELASKADADARQERLGGPALFAVFDEAGNLERVPMGQFADRVDAHTRKMSPNQVAIWVERNLAAMREFWAFNSTDALALKKILEARSNSASSSGGSAKAASPSSPDSGGAAGAARGRTLTGDAATRMRISLVEQIQTLDTMSDCLSWIGDARAIIDSLPEEDRLAVDTEFQRRQSHINGD